MLAVLLLRYAKVRQALTVWQEHAVSAHFSVIILASNLGNCKFVSSGSKLITVIDKFWD